MSATDLTYGTKEERLIGDIRCELRDVHLQALARMGYQHLRLRRHSACILSRRKVACLFTKGLRICVGSKQNITICS